MVPTLWYINSYKMIETDSYGVHHTMNILLVGCVDPLLQCSDCIYDIYYTTNQTSSLNVLCIESFELVSSNQAVSE